MYVYIDLIDESDGEPALERIKIVQRSKWAMIYVVLHSVL